MEWVECNTNDSQVVLAVAARSCDAARRFLHSAALGSAIVIGDIAARSAHAVHSSAKIRAMVRRAALIAVGPGELLAVGRRPVAGGLGVEGAVGRQPVRSGRCAAGRAAVAAQPLPGATSYGQSPVTPTPSTPQGITHAQVSQGLRPLPNDHGQVWREYDITPYTIRNTTTAHPEQAIVDWILRETGYEAWHATPVGLLSADRKVLRVYHTPQMQAIVADIVDRFVSSQAQNYGFGLRDHHDEEPQLAGAGAAADDVDPRPVAGRAGVDHGPRGRGDLAHQRVPPPHRLSRTDHAEPDGAQRPDVGHQHDAAAHVHQGNHPARRTCGPATSRSWGSSTKGFRWSSARCSRPTRGRPTRW